MAVAVGDGGAIVADRHGFGAAPQPEAPHHVIDVPLVRHAARVADLTRQRGKLEGVRRHAARLSLMTPNSGSCMGG